jgi:nucleoid DNA-binding protein
LKPKSYKDFKKDLAEKVGVHPDVVDDFITFYYAKIRKNLSELSYPSIAIHGLGTFHLRRQVLDKAIKKNKSILGNLAKNTYMGYEKHIGVKDKLEKMLSAKEMLDQANQEKKEFKDKKNES